MKNVWPTLIFLLYFKPTQSLKCNLRDNCLCLSGPEFEFQCPPNFSDVGGYVIHIIENNEILIDCSFNMKEFDLSLLPNVTVERVERFRMRFCPLPPRNFKEVMDRFGVKKVDVLQFASSELENVTLSKKYFEGLEELQGLQLDDNGLVEIEEDVFENTPKLTSLELQMNRLRLKGNVLAQLPLLKSLDLSQNHLELLPEGLFQKLEKLELLHLWGNNLETIDDLTFSNLKNLKSLELSSNKIENISENAFKELTNLNRINLSRNQLKTLPPDLFSHNKFLKLVFLKTNHGLQLPEYLFSNLSLFEEVDLTDCKLKTIPGNIFENSQNIKIIRLDRNKLKLVPEDLFQGCENLAEIYLNGNNIEKIGTVFKSLKKLKILSIQNNKLSSITENDFEDLVNLEQIVLRENQIETIHNRAFYKNNNLQKIDLSHNQYSGEYNPQLILLENVKNAESVNLSYNLITQIENVIALYNKVNLRSLDLSHNRITNINLKDLQPLAKKLTIKLEYNNIQTVNFNLVEYIASIGDPKDALSYNDPSQSVIFLANNPIVCDCRNFDLLRYIRYDMMPEVRMMFDLKTEDLHCASPKELEHFSLETLPPKLLICPVERGCPKECTCSRRPYDQAIIMDCSARNLTEFPQIDFGEMTTFDFNQTEMHLEGNYLKEGPDKNLTHYENITELYLSYNEIKTISWLPPKLRVLKLDNNQIKGLSYNVLHILNTSNLFNLTLDHNPWICECGAENLTNFLRQNTKIVDARNIHCFNSTNLLIELNRNDLCHEWQSVYLVLIILIILFLIAVTLALYYRYQQELKVWLFAHNLCLWWVTEEELDKEKIYDAFISYSHRDEDFVTQNLLPVLEGGPQPYKLCLHYRNWIPGEFITTQVTNSVLESRRTLVVLSPNFLESVWGKMEFRTAHTQAMTEGRARVIIVLYGDVDVDTLDEELKSYLKTNTYVKWGDPYFWNKLKYALPHSKRNVANNNQKIANVMNCIDDKFTLVTPITPNSGSTPPVLALDANGLKKHPLNFVARQELDRSPAETGLLVSTGL